MTFLIFAALTGCAPDDANINGDWFVWLAANSSPTVAEDELSLDGASIFECSGRGWDAERCMFDPGYIGPTVGGFSDEDEFIGGACARMNAEGNFNIADGACDGEYADSCTEEDVTSFAEECEQLHGLAYNRWIVEDGYYGLSGQLESWRSEALINSEGDLQLTVHIDLGNDQDFRFHFSIDPNFAPDECLEKNEDDEDGAPTVYRAFQDGSNWVQEWSEDEEGNQIFYLNAGAFQVDPNDSDNSWYFSDDMVSGYGASKFAAGEFNSRAGDYGHYDLDGTGLLWGQDALSGSDLFGGFLGVSSQGHSGELGLTVDPNDYVDWREQYLANLDQLCHTVKGAACEATNDEPLVEGEILSWEDEMVTVLGAVNDLNNDGILDEGEARFEHKIESNMWRPIDGTVSGVDGWMEVHSSWVRLQTGQVVAPGENVKGDYQILYEGTEAGSRLLIRGEFEITNLEMDEWGYDRLEDVKREENGTPYCGGADAPK
jgi:hypothetical protein